MRQALHIFKKDTRHLRIEILVVSAVIAVFAYLGAHSHPILNQYASPIDRLSSVYELLLPLAWWYLIAAVVQEEPVPGERQFWITRPYSRISLLGAKTLFILMFLNLPMLLADCIILLARGFEPWSYLPGMLFRQLILFIVWFLPFAALAAITANLKQFVLLLLMLPLVYIVSILVGAPLFLFYWGGAEWIPISALILVGFAATFTVLQIQFAKRRTTLARGIALCAFPLALVVPPLFPRTTAYDLQFALSHPQTDEPAVTLVLDPTRRRPVDLMTGGEPGTVEIDIPVRAKEVPEKMDLVADHLAISIRTSDGKSWSVPGRNWLFPARNGQLWLKLHVDSTVFEQTKNSDVTLRMSSYLTLLGGHHITPVQLGRTSTEVPGMGRCSFWESAPHDYAATCESPFRGPAVFYKAALSRDVSLDTMLLEGGSYSPYAAELGISPRVLSLRGTFGTSEPPNGLIIVTAVPLAHFHRDFRFSGVHLGNFAHD